MKTIFLFLLFYSTALGGQINSKSPGLQMLLHLNEGSGTSAYDCVRGSHYVISGGAWVSGKFGTGLYFDGSTYITLNTRDYDEDFKYSTFTWVFWAKPDFTAASLDKVILDCSQGGGTNSYVFYLPLSGGNYIYAEVYEKNGDQIIAAPYLLPPVGKFRKNMYSSRWMMFAWVIANGKMTLYWDGVEGPTTYVHDHTIRVSTDDVFIGKTFRGIIDEVGYWKRGVSGTEIMEMYDPTKADYTD